MNYFTNLKHSRPEKFTYHNLLGLNIIYSILFCTVTLALTGSGEDGCSYLFIHYTFLCVCVCIFIPDVCIHGCLDKRLQIHTQNEFHGARWTLGSFSRGSGGVSKPAWLRGPRFPSVHLAAGSVCRRVKGESLDLGLRLLSVRFVVCISCRSEVFNLSIYDIWSSSSKGASF